MSPMASDPTRLYSLDRASFSETRTDVDAHYFFDVFFLIQISRTPHPMYIHSTRVPQRTSLLTWLVQVIRCNPCATSACLKKCRTITLSRRHSHLVSFWDRQGLFTASAWGNNGLGARPWGCSYWGRLKVQASRRSPRRSV